MEPSQNTAIYKKASFKRRFSAFIIDTILLYILYTVVSLILVPLKQFSILIDFLIGILYGSIFIWYKGATPGKMLLKIKVVNNSYKPVSFIHALLRESVGKFLSEIVLNLGYFWVIIDKKNQAWHDKIAGTLVVKLDNKNNLIPIKEDEPVTLKRKATFTGLFLVFGFPLVSIVAFLIIYLFIFRPFAINGDSMSPNYLNGQYYITNLNYGNLARGDVIIFKAPPNPQVDYDKRIIGLPGDKISINAGNVYLNGNLLNESAYLAPNSKTYPGAFLKDGQAIVVPDNNYFVMGDNRQYSSDSREWGFVPKSYVISKVAFCYYKCKQATILSSHPTPIETPTTVPTNSQTPTQTTTSTNSKIYAPTPTPTPTQNSIYIKFVNGSGQPVNVPGQQVTISNSQTGWSRTVTSDTVFTNVPPAHGYILHAAMVNGYKNSTGFYYGNDAANGVDFKPYDNQFDVLTDKPTTVSIGYYTE